jgi:hypothetical protein
MASAPSKRAQRQAKRGMIQPALPLLPGLAKKKVEPAAPSVDSSVDGKVFVSPQVAELDIREKDQGYQSFLNGQEASSDTGGTPGQTSDIQSLIEETGAGARVQSFDRTAETNNVDTVAQNGYGSTEKAAVEFQSASTSQTETLPTSTPSTSNEAIGSDEYPGVVMYETSQYGQASNIDSKAVRHETTVDEEINNYQESAVDSVADQPSSTAFVGERISEDSDAQQSNGSSTSATSLPPVDTSNGASVHVKPSLQSSVWPTVTDHLLQLCTNKTWADWVIAVTGGKSPAFATYAHGMMLARSPRIRKMMEHQTSSPQGNVISLVAPMPISPHAFEAALRYLYSDIVLSADSLFPDGPPERINFLPYILSYWVSGVALGIDAVVERAVQLLREFLDWDVLEAVIKEADDLSTGLKKDELRNFPDWPNVVTQWKAEALSFCAARMKVQGFILDAESTSSIVRPRFAALEERPLKHNPALASMVFGSMPTPTESSPVSPKLDTVASVSSPLDRTISHILLNVDYLDLVFFYQQLRQSQDGADSLQLLEQLVSEREKQRLRMVSSRTIPNKNRMANSEVWDIAANREFLDNGELRRERVSFLLPTKK